VTGIRRPHWLAYGAATLAAVAVVCFAGGTAWDNRRGDGAVGTDRSGIGAGGGVGLPPLIFPTDGLSSSDPATTAPTAGTPGHPGTPGEPTPTAPAGTVPTGTVATAAPVQPTTNAPPAASTNPFSDGSYTVGRDIVAGSWATGGVLNLSLKVCTYSINGGTPVQIVVSVGLTTVHLHDGDRFVTSGCKPWRLT